MSQARVHCLLLENHVGVTDGKIVSALLKTAHRASISNRIERKRVNSFLKLKRFRFSVKE